MISSHDHNSHIVLLQKSLESRQFGIKTTVGMSADLVEVRNPAEAGLLNFEDCGAPFSETVKDPTVSRWLDSV